MINYIEAEYQAFKASAGDSPLYIQEQAVYRLDEIKKKSPNCLKPTGYCDNCEQPGLANEVCTNCYLGTYSLAVGTRCVHCGCETYDKVYQQQGCDNSCFGERMKEEEWLEFKKQKNIRIC